MPKRVDVPGDREHYTLTVDDMEHLRRGNSLALNESVEIDLTSVFWDKLGEPRRRVEA